MYRVIVAFKDLIDKHVYQVGDVYPRDGYEPPKERIKELSTIKNKRGIKLIKKVQDEEQ